MEVRVLQHAADCVHLGCDLRINLFVIVSLKLKYLEISEESAELGTVRINEESLNKFHIRYPETFEVGSLDIGVLEILIQLNVQETLHLPGCL